MKQPGMQIPAAAHFKRPSSVECLQKEPHLDRAQRYAGFGEELDRGVMVH